LKSYKTIVVLGAALAASAGCSKKDAKPAEAQAVKPAEKPADKPTDKPAEAAPAAEGEKPAEAAPAAEGDKPSAEGDKPTEGAPAMNGEAPAEGGEGAAPAAAPEGGAPAVAPEGGAPTAAPEGAAPAVPAGPNAADLLFRPAEHGFKFENYGADPAIMNMTAAELRRMFGDAVCASIQGETCLLTPPAQNWMQSLNKAMDGGHCEGLAALSLLAYTGKIPADSLGGPVAGLEKSNEKVQREIAYWFATQATFPTRAAEIKTMTPTQIVDTLAAAFAAGKEGESYTMGIYKPGYQAGHAITLYAIRADGETKVSILVYDNNYPGAERAIEVDKAANTWKYSASTNPNEAASIYAGDATTFTLTVTASSKRLEQQLCPFCGEVPVAGGAVKGSLAGGATPTAEVWLAGDADLFITNAAGQKLGHVDGKLVSEIPGGSSVALKSNELWSDDEEPVYTVPVGKMTVTVDGSKLTAATMSDVTLVAPAYSLSVEGISVDPGQKDELSFSEDMHTFSYKTTGQETPVLEFAVTTDGADYEFEVKAVGDGDGQEIELSLDPVKGELRLEVRGHEGATEYGIVIHRIDAQGEASFTHMGNSLESGAAVSFGYGEWKGQGTEMPARIDKGDDGSVDETLSLSDSE
jgi:hypothetical protein